MITPLHPSVLYHSDSQHQTQRKRAQPLPRALATSSSFVDSRPKISCACAFASGRTAASSLSFFELTMPLACYPLYPRGVCGKGHHTYMCTHASLPLHTS